MALVSEIELTRKERQTVHRPTRCLCSILHSPEGEPFIQLDTYGSPDRQFTEKVSQSIQLDARAAAQLKKIIEDTFPELSVGT